MAVFAAGHRTMYKTDLRNFDAVFRKLLRSVVGPLQVWIGPVHGMKSYMTGTVGSMNLRRSERCVHQHSDLAHYISFNGQSLMQWQPNCRRRGGRPAHHGLDFTIANVDK